jgi:hypothetical protein
MWKEKENDEEEMNEMRMEEKKETALRRSITIGGTPLSRDKHLKINTLCPCPGHSNFDWLFLLQQTLLLLDGYSYHTTTRSNPVLSSSICGLSLETDTWVPL